MAGLPAAATPPLASPALAFIQVLRSVTLPAHISLLIFLHTYLFFANSKHANNKHKSPAALTPAPSTLSFYIPVPIPAKS